MESFSVSQTNQLPQIVWQREGINSKCDRIKQLRSSEVEVKDVGRAGSS